MQCVLYVCAHGAMSERTNYAGLVAARLHKETLVTSLVARNSRPHAFLCSTVQPILST